MGCSGEVTLENGEFKTATGYTCKRGSDYAKLEVTSPKRMLTTTVRVRDGELNLLPVASDKPLPKNKVLPAARCLAGVQVVAPIKEGDIIYENILDLGVNIIATRDLAKR
jgi:CxxC motif-containing protein